MSVTFKDYQIRIIYDKNNIELFKFYIGTLLDHLTMDLWGEIVKYMNYSFACGLCSEEYPGYRKMNTVEFNECNQKILDYYFANDGLDKLISTEIIWVDLHLLIDDYKIVNPNWDNKEIYNWVDNNHKRIQLCCYGMKISKNDKFCVSEKQLKYKNTITIMVPKI
jgi:hypothetical protein